MRLIWRTLAVGALCAAIGSTQEPAGPPFRIDDDTGFVSREPAVAATDAGFRVVWTSLDQDGSGPAVFSRGVAFDSTLDLELQVNEYTTGTQETPQIAAVGSGGFVIVWAGEGSGDVDGIFGRLFDASGRPTTGDFLVNEVTVGTQVRPSVDAAGDGSFAVVWLNELLEGTLFEVTARRFDASGAPTTADVSIGLSSDDGQGLALAAAAVADRNIPGFVVSWLDGESVLTREVSDSGTAGPVTTVSTGQHPFPDPAQRPQVAFDEGGKGWYTWGRRETIENSSTQGRRFDGSVLLGQVDLVPVSADLAESGSLSLARDRGFAVTYTDYQASPNVEFRNRVRVFEADGAELADVPVSLFGGFTQVGDLAHASSNPNSSNPKDFLVVWRQDDAVLGRRFTDPVFADGFESGDTSAWSSTVP